MNKNILGILPCAGSASRLYNLPKFMLPLKDEKKCLLSRWINLMIHNNCNKIVIGVSDSTIIFVNHLINSHLKEHINKIKIKLVGQTQTMNETVNKILKNENYDFVLLGMPDTYIDRLSPLLFNKINTNQIIGAYIWNIRKSQLGKIGQCEVNENYIINIVDKDINCNFNYGWGSLIFTKEFVKYILDEQQHIGYSMKEYLNEKNKICYEIINGQYFDCGTVTGYKEYLNFNEISEPIYIKGTIIIMAVHIDERETSYNTLIKCLKKNREIYKKEHIILIDNKSINKNWYSLAKKLEMNILVNNSNLHGFEIGAYRLALQNYRADNYIFIQGTFLLNRKLDLKLNNNLPSAYIFRTLNFLNWSNQGLELINKLLLSVNMDKRKNNDPLVLNNSFYCNNLFVNELLNSGLLDLPCNSKNHSCAFERVLGCFIFRKLKVIKVIDEKYFSKHFLRQKPNITI